MDRFEAAARGAYICFRPAGCKPIIVKRLWAYLRGKQERGLVQKTRSLMEENSVSFFYY